MKDIFEKGIFNVKIPPPTILSRLCLFAWSVHGVSRTLIVFRPCDGRLFRGADVRPRAGDDGRAVPEHIQGIWRFNRTSRSIKTIFCVYDFLNLCITFMGFGNFGEDPKFVRIYAVIPYQMPAQPSQA